MKIKERDMLLDLHAILAKVPFPHDGMVMVDNLNRYPDLVEAEEYEEGWDYHDPALTLKAIQGWQKPDRYGLKRIYKDLRKDKL